MKTREGKTGDELRVVFRRIMPRPLVHLCKKLYYPAMLGRFRESQWPYATIAKRLVRPGDWVVDVGANIGYITLLFSRWVGNEGRVLGFEPVPDTYDLLSHNMRALKLSNVVVRNCALSDKEGDAVMEIPLYDKGGGENLYESRIVLADRAQKTLRAVSVHTITLDSVFIGKAPPWPSFVKIDVEGHEAPVLDGMQFVLNEAKPALLIELSGSLSERAQFFQKLHGMGYAAYAWTGEGLQLRPEPENDVDCFFLQPQHKSLLEEG